MIAHMDQPTAQTQVNTPLPSYPGEAPKKSKKFLRAIITVVILLAIILGAKQLLFSSSGKKIEAPAITPTPTEYQFPTDTPVPTEAQTTPEPCSAKPTTNPVDKATGLDRSELMIEVQNGSGVTGAAAKAADVLKVLGYKIESTGNADNSDYANVTIQVKSAKSTFLPLLKKDLGFSYTVGTTSADLSSSSTADALVIIGK